MFFFLLGSVNLSDVSNDRNAVKCVVADARPKPVFSWYIGDEELSDLDTEDHEQEDDSIWTQTLLYKPEAGHANRYFVFVNLSYKTLSETWNINAFCSFPMQEPPLRCGTHCLQR